MIVFRRSHREGFVLVAVLALSTLAAAIAMEVAYLVRTEGERVAIEQERVQAGFFSEAGTLLAKDVILADLRDIDSREDIWNTPIFLNRPEGGIAVKIFDESGKFPVNRVINKDGLLDIAMKDALERLCARLDIPGFPADDILDFIDADDLPFRQGAESNYYTTLDPPRIAANRALIRAEELLGVRGLGTDDGRKLIAIVSTHGGTRINVNTAPADVIAALVPTLSRLTAERLASRAEVFPFRSLDEFAEVAGVSSADAKLASVAGVNSDLFRIESAGTSGSVNVVTTMIVRRSDEGLQMLYRRVD